jgi:glucose/arabinose dehydrogenase
MTRDRRVLLAATVPVTSGGEGGVLGIAVDPDFGRNRFVYLYRTTAGNGENQVARYRLVGVRLISPMVIVRGIPAAAAHDGGRIHFGPDRGLYISTGEVRQPPLAQSRGSLGGKFLRLGSPTYRGTRAVRPEIFSLGHRNPQGFDWQPRTGLLVSTDHGPTGFDGPHGDDEINIVRRGSNHGWPIVEGTQRRAGLIPPAVLYRNPLAPSGATFVHKPGSLWSGDFLVAALRGEQIRRIRLRGGRAVIDQSLFAGSFGRLRTVIEGPDGALYALTSNRDGHTTPRPGDDRVLRIVPPAG